MNEPLMLITYAIKFKLIIKCVLIIQIYDTKFALICKFASIFYNVWSLFALFMYSQWKCGTYSSLPGFRDQCSQEADAWCWENERGKSQVSSHRLSFNKRAKGKNLEGCSSHELLPIAVDRQCLEIRFHSRFDSACFIRVLCRFVADIQFPRGNQNSLQCKYF